MNHTVNSQGTRSQAKHRTSGASPSPVRFLEPLRSFPAATCINSQPPSLRQTTTHVDFPPSHKAPNPPPGICFASQSSAVQARLLSLLFLPASILRHPSSSPFHFPAIISSQPAHTQHPNRRQPSPTLTLPSTQPNQPTGQRTSRFQPQTPQTYQTPKRPLPPRKRMGNLCGKSSRDDDPFSRPGRRLGDAPPRPTAPSASVPSSAAKAKQPSSSSSSAQPPRKVGGPPRTLGGTSGEASSPGGASAEEARAKAAAAAEVSFVSFGS